MTAQRCWLAVVLLACLGSARSAIPAPQAPPPQSPPPEQPEPETPFDQGRISVGLSGGSGGTTDDRYFALGVGVGVFVLDGLELATEAEWLIGRDPFVSKLSPSVRYIFFQVPTIHPYLGGLYTHWFIADDLDDVDALGGRLGIIAILDRNAFAGGGVVHEVIVSACEEDCSETYPEIFFSLSF